MKNMKQSNGIKSNETTLLKNAISPTNNVAFSKNHLDQTRSESHPNEIQDNSNMTKRFKTSNHDRYVYQDDSDFDVEHNFNNHEMVEIESDKNKALNITQASFNLPPKKLTSSELICAVCGSIANGYNFDAITCESCKAFFRRNAFKSVVSIYYSNN